MPAISQPRPQRLVRTRQSGAKQISLKRIDAKSLEKCGTHMNRSLHQEVSSEIQWPAEGSRMRSKQGAAA
jgi:hypothetical protein